ncbi:MAG: hypothetical protein WA702_17965 [Bradyrhizobium sp.]|jgi:hypothetical protein|uniref:hypothetical protein n=1 Tax=Bradyrhizobium sp. TaxID=376 RepID=UPI003C7BC685
MRKMPLKALVSLLALHEGRNARRRRDRMVLVGSTLVPVGLIALYAYGKASGRW